MKMPSLSLVVLRCRDLEASRAFYELLELSFVEEKHGAGPKHYSCQLGGTVLELYPLTTEGTPGLRLGIEVTADRHRLVSQLGARGYDVKRLSDDRVLVVDPDGHKVEVCWVQPS